MNNNSPLDIFLVIAPLHFRHFFIRAAQSRSKRFYLWRRARRVTQPQPQVYNMIREEPALVKQNGAWKPRRKKDDLAFFTLQMGKTFGFAD